MEIQLEWGIQQTVYFTMVKAGSTDLAASGDWTPAATDCDLIKDGASSAQASNTITSEGDVVWSLVLDADETQAKRLAISIVDSATKAVEDNVLLCTTILSGQIAATRGIFTIQVDDTDFPPTTTQAEFVMVGPILTEEATADHFNGRLIEGTGVGDATRGALTDITDSELANSKIKLTFTALAEAPPDGSQWVIL